MAYNTDYLSCINYNGGKQGTQLWTYTTTDNAAAIAGAGYVSDATKKGMNVNDLVIVSQVTTLPNTTPTGVSTYVCSAISSGAATLIKTATA